MPPPHPLALVSDDEALLKALHWQLHSELLELKQPLLLRRGRQGASAGARAQLEEALSHKPSALITALYEPRALDLSLQLAKRAHVPVVVCSPEPSLDEVKRCLRGGALDYVEQPWRQGPELVPLIVKLISEQTSALPAQVEPTEPTEPIEPTEPTEPTALTNEMDRRALLLSLIDCSRSFQEALTPLEDELRQLYLQESLKRAQSLHGAAKLAGVDRSNFKRLLKRYRVTREGEGR